MGRESGLCRADPESGRFEKTGLTMWVSRLIGLLRFSVTLLSRG